MGNCSKLASKNDDGDGGGFVTNLRPTLATPWTIAHQAPLSLEFSNQKSWSR